VAQAVVKGKICEVVTVPATCSVVAKVKRWLLLKLNGIFFCWCWLLLNKSVL